MEERKPGSRARQELRGALRTEGIAELMHVEAFLSALHHITQEEHEEAAAWLVRRRRNGGVAESPEPSGIIKMQELPELDDHFWDCCDRYRMYDTEYRFNFIRRICVAVAKGRS